MQSESPLCRRIFSWPGVSEEREHELLSTHEHLVLPSITPILPKWNISLKAKNHVDQIVIKH